MIIISDKKFLNLKIKVLKYFNHNNIIIIKIIYQLYTNNILKMNFQKIRKNYFKNYIEIFGTKNFCERLYKYYNYFYFK